MANNLLLRNFFLALTLTSLLVVFYQLTQSTSKLQNVLDSPTFKPRLAYFPQKSKNLTTTTQTTSTIRPRKFSIKEVPEKIIALYRPNFVLTTEALDKKDCGNCRLSTRKDEMWNENTGAVFVPWNVGVVLNLPGIEKRRPDQLFVWFAMEGPSLTSGHNRGKYKPYPNGFFNASFTFKRDSTFYNPVWRWFTNISVVNFVTTQWGGVERDPAVLMERKKSMAIWFVSNCGAGSNSVRRIQFSQQLIDAGLKLERYGGCFKGNGPTPRRGTSQFFRKIESYKFYMSFENSLHCKDYITEKFYVNGLAAGSVPVVFGAIKSDYEEISPPHSFIFAEDYKTPKDLVDYLTYLDKNDTAYAEYLAWRYMDPHKNYPYGKRIGLCSVCRTMYGISPKDERTFEEIYVNRNETYPPNRVTAKMRLESVHEFWESKQPNECF